VVGEDARRQPAAFISAVFGFRSPDDDVDLDAVFAELIMSVKLGRRWADLFFWEKERKNQKNKTILLTQLGILFVLHEVLQEQVIETALKHTSSPYTRNCN
jgi:hypothetical protein